MRDAARSIKAPLAFASSVVAGVIALAAPALTFDITITSTSSIRMEFVYFFQITVTVAFLVLYTRKTSHARYAPLIALSIAALTFGSYALLREYWSCEYFNMGRVVVGGAYREQAQNTLSSLGLLGADCLQVLSAFGGRAENLWPVPDLVMRFLLLFVLFSLSWVALAVAILSAVSGVGSARGDKSG